VSTFENKKDKKKIKMSTFVKPKTAEILPLSTFKNNNH